MALERIDPGDYPGEPISLDHYARYAFAGQFAAGKRVLDAACGTGYGSAYLRAAGAKKVKGIDVSTETIRVARKRLATRGLTFTVADAHQLSKTIAGKWDLIVSFETIEHLAEPSQFIAECRALLAPGGVLVASVPNAAQDPEAANEFHLQRFGRSSFAQLLGSKFTFVEIRSQYFCLGSLIDIGEYTDVAGVARSATLTASAVPGADDPECFVGVCANDHLPELHQSTLVHARKFWDHHQTVVQGKSWLEEQLAESQRREAELTAELGRQRAQVATAHDATRD